MKNLGGKIRKLRESLGLEQVDFAKLFGVPQSTVSKWELGKQRPNGERTAKIAELAGQTVGEFLGLRPLKKREAGARTYRVVGTLQAGAWKEAIEWDYDDQYDVPVPLPAGMPDIHLKGYVVGGPSMNKIYPDGAVVFVAATIANKLQPQNGQRVLVQRRNKDGLYEATLKEYIVNDDGTRWLWPRSYDPEHQAPVQYKGTNAEEVTVTGIVMASFIMEAVR